MRNKGTTNEKWRNVMEQTDRFRFETKVIISAKDDYGNDVTDEYYQTTAPVITRQLMDAPLSVGNCNSASMVVTLLLADDSASPHYQIPKAATAQIKGRVKGEEIPDSDWKSFGTFYLDQRKKSHDERLVTLSCYDAMMKANAAFLPSEFTVSPGESWPKYMSIIVEEIAEKLDVTVDPTTLAALQEKESGTHGADYRVPRLEGMTIKTILEEIAACHGGNFILTEDNLLRLVKLKDSLTDADTAAAIAVLGDLDTGQSVTITGVSRERDDGEIYIKGDDNGFVVKLGRRNCATDNMVDALYSELNGKIYLPFTATKTVVDPAVELGDRVTLGDKGTFPLLTQKFTLDVSPYMDISAPGNEEMSEEYPYLTEREIREMAVRKLEADTHSRFEVTQEAISSEITRAKGTEENLSSRITQNANSITLEVARTAHSVGLFTQQKKDNNGNLLYLDDYGQETTVVTDTPAMKDLSVSSKLSMESDSIKIEADRLTIDATNFKLSANGTVSAKNFSASGSFESINEVGSGSSALTYKTVNENGFLNFYLNSSLVGRIGASRIINDTGIMIDIGSSANYGGFAVQTGNDDTPATPVFYYERSDDHFISKIPLRVESSIKIMSGSHLYLSTSTVADQSISPGTNAVELYCASDDVGVWLTTTNNFYACGKLRIDSDATISGQLIVGGISTSGNITLNGNLTSGSQISGSTLNVNSGSVLRGHTRVSSIIFDGGISSNGTIGLDVADLTFDSTGSFVESNVCGIKTSGVITARHFWSSEKGRVICWGNLDVNTATGEIKWAGW